MSRQYGGEAHDQYSGRAPAERRSDASRRDDPPYRDEYPPPNDYYPDDTGRGDTTSRRPREQRQPADAEYWEDRRDRDDRKEDRGDRDRGRGRGPELQHGGYPPPRDVGPDHDQYGGGNPLEVENKLIKAEMDELVNQLESMRRENEAMHQRVDDARKEVEQRDRNCDELRQMCRKLEEDNTELRRADNRESGSNNDRDTSAADMEKLKAQLDKKTRLVDKLMSDKRDGEKAVYEELKSELQSLLKENDKLKKSYYSGSRGEDSGEQMESMASLLKSKEQLISEINEEKDELMSLLEEEGIKERYVMMKEKSRALKKTISELKEQNDRLEAELAELKAAGGDMSECQDCDDTCRKSAPNCDNKKESRKKTGGGKVGGAAAAGKDFQPLQNLVREQESHIIDLQREVDTLRHAINDYQKELERTDPDGRAMAEDKALRLFPSLKAEREDAEDMRRELDQSRRKLRSSNRRVAQLEKWLDEIYNDKNLEIVVKGSTFKGRRTTLTLPEIQGASGAEPTSTRKAPPLRRQYLLAKSGRRNPDSARKTNRSMFYQ